jgi:phosphate transport system substrate-binding protein
MIRIARLSTVSILSVLTIVIGGCSADETSPGQPQQVDSGALHGKLVLTGSTSMFPMIQEIARRFKSQHPEVDFEIRDVGSINGISDVRLHKADIGMSARALNDNEHDLFGFVIARDGLCFVVNKDNPIENLSIDQLASIYLGKVTNWQELGGKNAPIAVIGRTENQAAVELVESRFHINRREIKAQSLADDNSEAIEAVANNANAIVYTSSGDAGRHADKGVPLKLLTINGIAATEESMRSGGFPLSRSLVLVTSEFPAGLKKAFIDFALSAQVTDLIWKYDFVPFID